jgi:hypothetical protein
MHYAGSVFRLNSRCVTRRYPFVCATWRQRYRGKRVVVVDNVSQLWSARRLKRGLRRHWVGMGEEIVITGDRSEWYGVLSIDGPDTSECLTATLAMNDKTYTEKLSRGGELVIQIDDVELVVVVRAVEGTRVLVELGTPRRSRATVAFLA